MENQEEIDVFVLDVLTDKKYLIQVPVTIRAIDLKKILEKLLNTKNFQFRYRSNLYKDDQILQLEDGDTIYIYKNEEDKMKKYVSIKSLKNGSNIIRLTGLLKFFLVKYITDKIIIIDRRIIKKEKLINIIEELHKNFELNVGENGNIKISTKENVELNIISYSNYISSEIDYDADINYLYFSFDEMIIRDIFMFWEKLSRYHLYHLFFEENLSKAVKDSYFEYSISSVTLLPLKDEIKYFKESQKCVNIVTKYLFREIKEDSSTNPCYGAGLYFSDQLDYISYKSGQNGINSSFSCCVSQIYYNNDNKENISECHDYSYEVIKKTYYGKKVKKYGLNFVRVKPGTLDIIYEKDLMKEKKNGSFIGNEYIITEREQILPLFNLEFKRNESLIIWRDPNFNINNLSGEFPKIIKTFIDSHLKLNSYFETNVEDTLEIIKRKKFNKIILISNIGKDLSGKRLVEIARQILGSPIIALFFSNNLSHITWLKSFENILFTININFFQKFISNFNEKALTGLKNEIEKDKGLKLIFTKYFLTFPKFIDKIDYQKIKFEEINPNFKKVIIRNIKNSNDLCMDESGNISFIPSPNSKNSNIWCVTIFENKITFFKNLFYLDVNNNRIILSEFMKSWFLVEYEHHYIIYYENKKQILTDNNNKAMVQNQNSKYSDQLFDLIDAI